MSSRGVLAVGLLAAAAMLTSAAGAFARDATGGGDCAYVAATGSPVAPDGAEDPILDARPLSDSVVYGGTEGTTDDPITVAGICVNTPIGGGTLECGVGDDADVDELLDAAPTPTDAYCVADGDDDHPDPFDAYVGVSSYEDDPAPTPASGEPSGDEGGRMVNGGCDGNGAGGPADNANGGSCIGVEPVPFACQTDNFDPDDTPICGVDPDADPVYDADEVEVGHPTPICGNDSGNQWEESARDGCALTD